MSEFNKEKIIPLENAISEAYRFIQKAEEAIHRLKTDEYSCYGSHQTATAKRASMDLTRSLVAVRNPYHK